MVAERYFCFGDAADEIADHYLNHYYGSQFFAAVRADTISSQEHLHSELARLHKAGCHDVILLPCAHDAKQVELLAAELDHLGITSEGSHCRALGTSM